MNASDKKEGTVPLSTRLPKTLMDEIEIIALHLFSDKTKILKECLALGLTEFKRKKPELMHAVEVEQNRLESERKKKWTQVKDLSHSVPHSKRVSG
jgi:hypothetical protein